MKLADLQFLHCFIHLTFWSVSWTWIRWEIGEFFECCIQLKESCMIWSQLTVKQGWEERKVVWSKGRHTFQGIEEMAISYRRECYSKWVPQKDESSSSEESEEDVEKAKTVMQSLSSIHTLMRQVSKVNTSRIQELRRRTRRKLEMSDWESEEDDEAQFECSSSRSRTCSCIKVFISRKSSADPKPAIGGKGLSDYGVRGRQQKTEVKETLDRAKRLLALRTIQTMRRPNDERQRKTFKNF